MRVSGALVSRAALWYVLAVAAVVAAGVALLVLGARADVLALSAVVCVLAGGVHARLARIERAVLACLAASLSKRRES